MDTGISEVFKQSRDDGCLSWGAAGPSLMGYKFFVISSDSRKQAGSSMDEPSALEELGKPSRGFENHKDAVHGFKSNEKGFETC